jgi:hypothetical protein
LAVCKLPWMFHLFLLGVACAARAQDQSKSGLPPSPLHPLTSKSRLTTPSTLTQPAYATRLLPAVNTVGARWNAKDSEFELFPCVISVCLARVSGWRRLVLKTANKFWLKRLHDVGAELLCCQIAWMIFPPRVRCIPLLVTKAKTMHTKSRFIINWYAAYNGIKKASFDFSPLLKSLMPMAPLIPRMVKGRSPYVRRNKGKLLPRKRYCKGRDAMKSRANGLRKHSSQAFKTQGFPSLAAHL